jgi:hypothetical protein
MQTRTIHGLCWDMSLHNLKLYTAQTDQRNIGQSARCGDDHIPAHVHASKTGWIYSELDYPHIAFHTSRCQENLMNIMSSISSARNFGRSLLSWLLHFRQYWPQTFCVGLKLKARGCGIPKISPPRTRQFLCPYEIHMCCTDQAISGLLQKQYLYSHAAVPRLSPNTRVQSSKRSELLAEWCTSTMLCILL